MSNRNEESLHSAVYCGDLAKVKTILTKDPFCINDWNLEFKTPLHMVYDHINDLNPVQADDRLSIMQLLIDYGADVNTRGPRHESALHLAVRKQQINGIKLLLENHSNPDIPNEYNGTALHFATHYKPGIIMKLLIKYKANLNTGDTFENTPLDMTIRHRNLNFLKILVKYRAKSLHIYDMISEVCDGSSKQRNQLFLKYLLKHASRLDINRNFSPEALSYYLTSKKHPRYHRGKKCLLIELLHKTNSNRNTQNSAMHLAVRYHDVKHVRYLIQRGANVNVKNKYGETPLHLALRKGSSIYHCETCIKIATLLIDNGSDFRVKNYLQETPFFLAAKTFNIQVVKLMLEKITGIPSTTYNTEARYSSDIVEYHTFNSNEPELHEIIISIVWGNAEVVDHLLDTYFNNKIKRNSCQDMNRALSLATETGQYKIVKLLLESGFRADEHFPSQVPHFDATNSIEDNLRIICLFWEFQDSVTINRAIINAFRRIVMNEPVIESSYLLVLLYAVCLHMNNLSADLIPAKGLFELHYGLSLIFSTCNEVLEESKKFKAGNMTFYDILTMPLNKIVKWLNNPMYFDNFSLYSSILEEKRDLEYMGYVMKCRFDLALEKRKLLNAAKDCVNEIFEGVVQTIGFICIPNEIIENILAQLNVRELKYLLKTMKATF